MRSASCCAAATVWPGRLAIRPASAFAFSARHAASALVSSTMRAASALASCAFSAGMDASSATNCCMRPVGGGDGGGGGRILPSVLFKPSHGFEMSALTALFPRDAARGEVLACFGRAAISTPRICVRACAEIGCGRKARTAADCGRNASAAAISVAAMRFSFCARLREMMHDDQRSPS